MPTITIYQNDTEIGHETINQEYYILETPLQELIWFENEIGRPGILKIWLQIRENKPLLCFLLPDWQLIINGNWTEKKFYEDIEDLDGKQVELQYKDHRFVFQLW